jgi:hypothetical protein
MLQRGTTPEGSPGGAAHPPNHKACHPALIEAGCSVPGVVRGRQAACATAHLWAGAAHLFKKTQALP